MKKLTFLLYLFITFSCSSERENMIIDEKPTNAFAKNSTDPLCIVPTPTSSLVNYGNPSNYPTINFETYYSLTPSANPRPWFFAAIIKSCTDYLNTKYYNGLDNFKKFYVASQVLGDSSVLQYDSMSNLNIYRSENYDAQELYPGNNVSPVGSSYALYKILSSIDEYVSMNPAMKPIGIYFDFDTTMCGDYSSLKCLVYYKVANRTRY
ncbi:hypothetical protein [Epilithonimonas zeae]|uniref:hypothetical protein n=1 Tax=Epilithonimonas zeae TaxID=1416779 RepID=UPI00200D72D7|nr:hypothetical protein [Epilithonimonas zeae]UQB69469.1 hypothetical protein KI430_03310 [Epilithonimonas zeae]